MIEILAFSGLAVGSHLAIWGAMSETGADSAGNRGDAVVSLAAASGDVSELIASWTAAPVVMESVAALAQATEAEDPPLLDVALTKPQNHAAPRTPGMAPADTAPAAPPQPAHPPLPTPDSVTQPDLPRSNVDQALLMPRASEPSAIAAPRAPTPPQPETPELQALPDVDQTPPSDRAAPRGALRPVLRPENLTRPEPPVAEAKPKETPKATRPAKAGKKAKQKNAEQKSAGAQKQVAAGASKGQNAGTKTTDAAAATLSKSQRKSLMASWGASIRNGVDRKKRAPAGNTASGTTVVRLSVSPHGKLLGAGIAKSSGDSRLDAAALKAVRSARIPKAPKGLSDSSYSFNLPIAFTK